MSSVGGSDCRGGDEVQVFGVLRRACRPVVGAQQGDRAVDHHCLDVRDPHLIIDPDRHARGGQGLDPACALARRGLVRDQSDINPPLLGTNKRLDDARTGC
jgi:hypothetical protein